MAREVAVVVVQVQIPVPCMTMIHAGEEVVQVLVRAKGLALDWMGLMDTINTTWYYAWTRVLKTKYTTHREEETLVILISHAHTYPLNMYSFIDKSDICFRRMKTQFFSEPPYAAK